MRISIKNDFSGSESTNEIFAAVLKSRGLKNKTDVENFLRPPIPTLKFLLDEIKVDKKELDKAKKIIHKAIKDGKDICIFGDYDADGITSTAVLWQTLSQIAKESSSRVMPFIPDRTRHGYGLSSRAVTDILEGTAFAGSGHPDFKPDLLITVDNGIVANEAVTLLKKEGIQVIVTDHHQKGPTLPACDALIHAVETSGAGIAWLTALSLTDSAEFVRDLIDLTAVGVVADQMPLVGVNRSIVVTGLAQLSVTKNKGLQALKELAGITGKQLSTYDINYVIAPRINAVGRLDNPLEALRLLCTRDAGVARKIAAVVEKHNSNRQELTDQAIESALKGEVVHRIVIAASGEFHEGIIGLVAGKLAESHNRPAVVMSIGEKVSKGSARSVTGINITNILRSLESRLISVGGHELAAGFSIETAQIPAFTEALYAYADEYIEPGLLDKHFTVDGILTLKQVTKELANLILRLEPFGMGNPKPRFVTRDLKVLEDRVIGKNGNHRKMVVEAEGVTRDVIWFNGSLPHPLRALSQMVFTPEINVWRDRESIQLNAQYVESDEK